MLQRIFLLVSILIAYTFAASSRAQEVLTWSDCLAEAKNNHPDLISAVESINQEKAAKEVTTSGVFPQTSAIKAASESAAV